MILSRSFIRQSDSNSSNLALSGLVSCQTSNFNNYSEFFSKHFNDVFLSSHANLIVMQAGEHIVFLVSIIFYNHEYRK